MEYEIQKNLAEAMKILAISAEEIKKQIDFDSISKVLDQCGGLIKTTEQLQISDSLIEMLSVLGRVTEPLTELQKIAITKEIEPRYLSLSDEQIRLRRSITKEEAILLAESSDVDVIGDNFTYKSEVISTNKIKEAIRTAQIFDDISLDEIMEFSSFIYKYPYLSASNNIGKKILEDCANIDDKYISRMDSESTFFRARVMKAEDEPFSEQEMRMAPFKIPGQGRFNTQGAARFYLSENFDDAVSEVKKHAKDVAKIQVAKYKATSSIKLLDMSKINNAWSKKCLTKVNNPGPFNVEYLCSGYLAQCIDFHKDIDGIMYGEEGHYLYMVFNDRSFIDDGMQYADV